MHICVLHSPNQFFRLLKTIEHATVAVIMCMCVCTEEEEMHARLARDLLMTAKNETNGRRTKHEKKVEWKEGTALGTIYQSSLPPAAT